MNNQIFKFLSKNRVCCLTVLVSGGAPHAAAMHFSYLKKPLEFYIQTERSSKKMGELLKSGSSKASVVVGFSEEDWATFQTDGVVTVVDDKSELEKIYRTHYAKNPQAKKYKNLPETVFLKFTPKWWRYTEFEPAWKVVSSEDKS